MSVYPTEPVRTAIRGLLRGEMPPVRNYGAWSGLIEHLRTIAQQHGAQGVQTAFEAAVRADKNVATLMAGALEPSSTPVTTVPALPPRFAELQSQAEPCAQWLDDYIAFGRAAAPMTPRSFHEAAALYAVSTIIARRIYLRVSTGAIYPNLFMLFVAPSSIYRKTTGMKLISQLFKQCGLGYMLLPQKMTPEAFVAELATGVPPPSADPKILDSWLKERAFAAQRSWMLDEASRLFRSMKSDAYAALLELMLDLYECPEDITERTIGRGRTSISSAYLSFFGATTPDMSGRYLASQELWGSGLWPRFILIQPDEPATYQFFPDAIDFPSSILHAFRAIAERFPTPIARWESVTDDDGTQQKRLQIYGEQPASHVVLADGVWDTWEAYDRALFDMVQAGAVRSPIDTAYQRLAKQTIKVAMILATMDGDSATVCVELRHLSRAITITERWRAMLHDMWEHGTQIEEERTADRIISMIADTGIDGIATRDIYRTHHLKSEDGRKLLEELALSGQIEKFQLTATNGRMVERWRIRK